MLQKFSLCFLFCVCSALCFAQVVAPAIQWQNTIGGSYIDQMTSLKQTPDGGYILGGWSGSNISGDKTENSTSGNNDYDFWVIKLNSNGNIVWQNTIGGVGDDKLYAVEITSDGGYILGGFSNSNISGDKTENTTSGNNDYDYWLVKLSALGNIVWQKTIGGTLNDKLLSLEKTLDGGFILAGESNSNISGLKTENVYGSSDYWVLKVDSVGNIQWQKDIGGTGGESVNDVHQTFNGDYIIVGPSNSEIGGNKTEPRYGVEDFWVVKLNSNGVIQWQKSLGGNLWEQGGEVIETTDGGYLVGGASYSGISGNKTIASYGDFDYWVIKLDSLGNIQWQKDYGGVAAEGLSNIARTNDSNYLLTGNSGTYTYGGYRNYWIVKIDILGNIIWQQYFGGTGTDAGICSVSTIDNGYLIGGYSNSNISGIKSENCFGLQDFWIVKLASDIACIGCPKPTNLSTIVINHHSAQLNWTTQPCAVGYRIRIRKVGTTTWSSINVSSNIGFKLLNNLLQANTSYEWQIRTVCSIAPLHWSGWTLLQNFTTPLRMEEMESATSCVPQIFPNPASDRLFISCGTIGANEISIYNLLGQKVKSKVNATEENISVADLPAGIYILEIRSEENFIRRKFVKE